MNLFKYFPIRIFVRIIFISFLYANIFGYLFVSIFWYKYIRIFIRIIFLIQISYDNFMYRFLHINIFEYSFVSKNYVLHTLFSSRIWINSKSSKSQEFWVKRVFLLSPLILPPKNYQLRSTPDISHILVPRWPLRIQGDPLRTPQCTIGQAVEIDILEVHKILHAHLWSEYVHSFCKWCKTTKSLTPYQNTYLVFSCGKTELKVQNCIFVSVHGENGFNFRKIWFFGYFYNFWDLSKTNWIRKWNWHFSILHWAWFRVQRLRGTSSKFCTF